MDSGCVDGPWEAVVIDKETLLRIEDDAWLFPDTTDTVHLLVQEIRRLNGWGLIPDTPHEKTCLCDACICVGCGETKHKGKCRRWAR